MAKWPYNTKTWKRMRSRFLISTAIEQLKQHYQATFHALCQHCLSQGLITEATHVDHIRAHKGDPMLAFDESNLQALCHRCHSTKTATKDGGFGNRPNACKARPKPSIDPATGKPTNVEHWWNQTNLSELEEEDRVGIHEQSFAGLKKEADHG